MHQKPDSIKVKVTCYRKNGSAYTFELDNITSSDELWAGIDIVLRTQDETIKSFVRMTLEMSHYAAKL
jgi:hypothetical protein